ncbi:MAG: DNA methyltransferase [Patescibacteria group bacterium]|nr:DNA methyltransferase [Patescibacteria group bacterium]
MKYIFHLGRISSLSVAEIITIFDKTNINYQIKFIRKNVLVIEINQDINFKELLPQMGGTIKISEVLRDYKVLDDITEKILQEVNKKSGRKTIGYSIYFENEKNLKTSQQVKKMFTDIKKSLSEKSSVRIVFPEKNKNELNSASVIKNKLTTKGWEFNFIFLNNQIFLTKTLAMQDVENYSRRDYDRPKKDSHTGMMPPKLAQIMINLANIEEGKIIFDPFCGIGTIPQEALLNDYKVIGSDANEKQVENCIANLKWISKKYNIKYPNYKIFQSDVGDIIRKISKNSIDAIVTESTLGPVYTKIPQKSEIKNNFNQLEKIYLRFFQTAKLVLRKKTRIVVTIPAYKIKQQYSFAPFIDKLEKIGYSIVCPLKREHITKFTKVTSRNSIVYDRPNQVVAREVMIFENK